MRLRMLRIENRDGCPAVAGRRNGRFYSRPRLRLQSHVPSVYVFIRAGTSCSATARSCPRAITTGRGRGRRIGESAKRRIGVTTFGVTDMNASPTPILRFAESPFRRSAPPTLFPFPPAGEGEDGGSTRPLLLPHLGPPRTRRVTTSSLLLLPRLRDKRQRR